PKTTNYKITGTDTNQCSQSDFVLITVKEKVGVQNPSIQKGFLLYPNPISNYVIIESPGNAELTIYMKNGKEIMKTKITQKISRINTSSLVSGVYIFSLKTEYGVKYFRVVKE
ncbi:MAG: T9SS type A sorting domain-containing protein, partial [Bacteroidia bacterium]